MTLKATMMKKRNPALPEGDDGRTIASMNVEGMPWYRPAADAPAAEQAAGQEKHTPMSASEARMYTAGAVKAALLVTLVMCGGIALFVAFCVFVWFR